MMVEDKDLYALHHQGRAKLAVGGQMPLQLNGLPWF